MSGVHADLVGLVYTTCRRVQFDFRTNGTLRYVCCHVRVTDIVGRYAAHELLTDDGHLVFPEGIHCALQSLHSTLKLPVLVRCNLLPLSAVLLQD